MMGRRFAVLSTYDAPLLGYLLSALRSYNATPDAVILDSRQLSEKGKKIHIERTADRFLWKPLHEQAGGVPVYFVESHKDATALSLIETLRLDFMINGGTPRILNSPILSSAELGVINCHPGRLPTYRGCTCPEWAIFNNEPVCNTVHRMTLGIDEGPILMTEEVVFPHSCSYQDMRVAVYLHGIDLLARAVRGLQCHALGAASFTGQASGGNYYKPISDEKFREVVCRLEHGLYSPVRQLQ